MAERIYSVNDMTNWQRNQWARAGYPAGQSSMAFYCRLLKPPKSAMAAFGMQLATMMAAITAASTAPAVTDAAHPEVDEGGACPNGCGGTLHLPAAENCSCHISPPCSACTDRALTCDACGWESPPPEPCWPDTTVPKSQPNPWWEMALAKPSHDLGGGRRVFDYDYDSRSGSTMVYRGKYEGPVTEADIIALLGDGTFGHRGPVLYDNGVFTYTKITD